MLTRRLVNVFCVFLHCLSESTLAQFVVVFFQLRAGWCSSHVALLALSRDAAADASELAVHSGFPSRCFFVFALLLVDVTRLRQVVLIGCFFCASALPSFEVSGCLVQFMSIRYFLSRENLVFFWRHYCSPQRLSSIRFVFRGKRPDMSSCICWFCHFRSLQSTIFVPKVW